MTNMFEQIKRVQHVLQRNIWVQLIVGVVRRFLRDECTMRARALTYTTLFALVPLFTVLLFIVSNVDELAPIRDKLLNSIYQLVLPKTAYTIKDYLSEFSEAANRLTLVGIFFIFMTCLFMLTEIERNFNYIWRVKKERWGWNWFRHYWTLLTLGPLSLSLVLITLSAIGSYQLYPSIRQWLLEQNTTGYMVDTQFWLHMLAFVITGIAFTFLYWGMPNREVPLKPALIVGFLSATAFTALKWGVGQFVGLFASYQLIYGAFAAFPLLLIWIYSFWVIVLFGVELNCRLTFALKQHDLHYHPTLEVLAILKQLHQAQKTGGDIKSADMVRILGIDGAEDWHYYATLLEQHMYVQETQDHDYVLTRNLNHVSVYQLIHDLKLDMPKADQLQNLPVALQNTRVAAALTDIAQQMEHIGEISVDAVLADVAAP